MNNTGDLRPGYAAVCPTEQLNQLKKYFSNSSPIYLTTAHALGDAEALLDWFNLMEVPYTVSVPASVVYLALLGYGLYGWLTSTPSIKKADSNAQQSIEKASDPVQTGPNNGHKFLFLSLESLTTAYEFGAFVFEFVTPNVWISLVVGAFLFLSVVVYALYAEYLKNNKKNHEKDHKKTAQTDLDVGNHPHDHHSSDQEKHKPPKYTPTEERHLQPYGLIPKSDSVCGHNHSDSDSLDHDALVFAITHFLEFTLEALIFLLPLSVFSGACIWPIALSVLIGAFMGKLSYDIMKKNQPLDCEQILTTAAQLMCLQTRNSDLERTEDFSNIQKQLATITDNDITQLESRDAILQWKKTVLNLIFGVLLCVAALSFPPLVACSASVAASWICGAVSAVWCGYAHYKNTRYNTNKFTLFRTVKDKPHDPVCDNQQLCLSGTR